jgi:ABC-type sugar transport system ATPase subunit
MYPLVNVLVCSAQRRRQDDDDRNLRRADEPDAGEVEVLGMNWAQDGPRLRQRLGIQLQETQLSDKLTVRETLSLFRSFFNQGPAVATIIAWCSCRRKPTRVSAACLADRSSDSRSPARWWAIRTALSR